MPRQQKPDEAKQERDIRVKVTEEEKNAFIQAASDDGMEAVSVWLKWLARRRMRQMERERGAK